MGLEVSTKIQKLMVAPNDTGLPFQAKIGNEIQEEYRGAIASVERSLFWSFWNYVSFRVGNGTAIYFWEDTWLDDDILLCASFEESYNQAEKPNFPVYYFWS